jgi:hypothetical protein
MFRLSRDGCTSLSVASILTRPFTILYIKTSLALCLLSSNVGHFSSSSMIVTESFYPRTIRDWNSQELDTATCQES